jgi:carboxymethylenebutenolidase
LPYTITESRPVGTSGTPALMCRPEAAGPFPCVMLLHERYGLVKHTEDLARKMSADGFVVCAPDLFYAHPDQAALHAGTVGAKPSDPEVLALLEDAFTLFAGVAGADASRFGMMGVCQTGRYPFVWAKHHPLSACISVYGAAQQSDWEVNARFPWGMSGLIDGIKTNVLGLFGEKDHVISFADVVRFRNALEAANLNYQVTVYADAPHGWLNDTMPGRYRPVTAKQTWDEAIAFLTDTLITGRDPSLIDWKFTARKHTDYDFTKNVRME